MLDQVLLTIDKFFLNKMAFGIRIQYLWPVNFNLSLKLRFRLLKTPTVPLYWVRLTTAFKHVEG